VHVLVFINYWRVVCCTYEPLLTFAYGRVLSTNSFVLHLCELTWVPGLFLTMIHLMRLGRKADHSLHVVRKLRMSLPI